MAQWQKSGPVSRQWCRLWVRIQRCLLHSNTIFCIHGQKLLPRFEPATAPLVTLRSRPPFPLRHRAAVAEARLRACLSFIFYWFRIKKIKNWGRFLSSQQLLHDCAVASWRSAAAICGPDHLQPDGGAPTSILSLIFRPLSGLIILDSLAKFPGIMGPDGPWDLSFLSKHAQMQSSQAGSEP